MGGEGQTHMAKTREWRRWRACLRASGSLFFGSLWSGLAFPNASIAIVTNGRSVCWVSVVQWWSESAAWGGSCSVCDGFPCALRREKKKFSEALR